MFYDSGAAAVFMLVYVAEAASTAAGWTLQPAILLKAGAYLVQVGDARASRTVRVLVN